MSVTPYGLGIKVDSNRLGIACSSECCNLHRAVDLGKIPIRYSLRRLVANTQLEARGAPVHELNRAFRLETSHGGMGFLGDDIAAIQQAGCHVFSVARVALDHLVVRLEARHGNLLHAVGFVLGFTGSRDGRVGNKREVNTWVGDQVGLEFVQVDVEGAVEAERGSDGRDDCIISETFHSSFGRVEIGTYPEQ